MCLRLKMFFTMHVTFINKAIKVLLVFHAWLTFIQSYPVPEEWMSMRKSVIVFVAVIYFKSKFTLMKQTVAEPTMMHQFLLHI